MKVSVDTNVLLRLVVGDDETQQRRATDALKHAEIVAIGTIAMCELVWVLDRSYGYTGSEIAAVIRRILMMRNVVTNRAAIEAGLVMLDAGGDFADGVIAFEGRWLGGETFVSFDRKAVNLLEKQGTAARLLS